MAPNQQHMLRKLVWDYSYTPDELNKLLSGETKQLGHLTKRTLFVRAMESLSWFSVLELFGAQEALKMLNEGAINEIRSGALRKRYEFARTRLRQIIPVTG